MAHKPLKDLVAKEGAGLIGQVDHIMYAVDEDHADAFIDTWNKLGFHEHDRSDSQDYDQSLISLTSGTGNRLPWGAMTGLAVSKKPESPVGRFLEKNGSGILYFAYHVNPEADMDELLDSMKAWGWNLMTPVLSYERERASAPLVKIIGVAPSVPWGACILFIQRFKEDGRLFDTFETYLWDELFNEYEEVSEDMEEELE